MKVFMFDKNLAIKNNCYTEKNLNVKLRLIVVVLSLLICLATFGGGIILLLLGLKGITYDIFRYIIIFASVSLMVYYIYDLIHLLAKYESPQRTAIVKENNTFWAVRLTFIPEIVTAINVNTATSLLSTISNVKSAKYNQKMEDELYSDREVSEKYIFALNNSRMSNITIMRDANKNYKYIFNGEAAVIRLDNIKFISENKDSEIYSYYDSSSNKIKKIKFFKVYSGLREEISNTQQDKHSDIFPAITKEHKNIFKANTKGIIVISIIAIVLLILNIKSVNYNYSNRLTDSDKKYVYNYLESTYGNGESLNVYSEKIRCFEYNDDVLGTEIFVIGYFDSKETAYCVTFRKLDKKFFDYEIGKMIYVAENQIKKSDLHIE